MKKTALIILTTLLSAALCACGKKPATENYFGGEGELKAEGDLKYDDYTIYSEFDQGTLIKYKKKTNTLSIACDNPDCGHTIEAPACKANMYYRFFNGSLIKKCNESILLNDGTIFCQGYLYLCDENERKIFKNELPEGIDPQITDNAIGVVYPLGDDYLVLFNGVYMYVLDADFNIKYTVIGVGTYTGGVYYVDNEIYYIDSLYRLQKLDMESGEPSPVDLGGMKVWEGTVKDNVLLFNNGESVIYSYDFQTGEIKKLIERGVAPRDVGKYIEYSNSDGTHYYDPESGETHDWPVGYHYMFFFDGFYCNYDSESGTLTLYEDDLTTVIKTAVLEA